MATTNQPRGIRNNNPLNIRIGNVWLGERQENTDGEFEQFVNMEYGCRAGFVLLRRYIRHYKLNTIRKIITRWAPRNENNTERYIKVVADYAQVTPDAPLLFEQRDLMIRIFQGMSKMECGMTITRSVLEKAYNMT